MLRIPEILTIDEQKTLLKQPNKRYRTGLRNYCIMLTMLNAGLRSSEVIKLKCCDIDFNSGKIKIVQGKGKKDRIVWIDEESLQFLQEWRERRTKGEFFFNNLKGDKLHSSYLRAALARYGKRADIEKRVHPHMLRHSFATDLYKQTKNIRLTQKALGHADLSTTMIYCHIVDDEIENSMKNFRKR